MKKPHIWINIKAKGPFARRFPILSPHCATQIADGHAHYVEDATANVLAYLAGQPIANLVDLRKGY
jgi:phosphoglycerate dehydrogenase-like enzyme